MLHFIINLFLFLVQHQHTNEAQLKIRKNNFSFLEISLKIYGAMEKWFITDDDDDGDLWGFNFSCIYLLIEILVIQVKLPCWFLCIFFGAKNWKWNICFCWKICSLLWIPLCKILLHMWHIHTRNYIKKN